MQRHTGMVVCEVKGCGKPLSSTLYTSEILVCDTCHNHFHLVLTKRQKDYLSNKLYNVKATQLHDAHPDEINMIDNLLEMLARD